MPRTSKADKLSLYQRDVERAVKFRKERGYDDTWRRMRDLYKGKYEWDGTPGGDRIAVNHAFSTVNVIVPAVSVNRAKITVWPTRPEEADRATITETVTNYQWEHLNLQDSTRDAAKDSIIIGHGWEKMSWRYVEEEQDRPDLEIAQEAEQQLEAAKVFAEENPDLADSVPSEQDILNSVATTTTVVLEDAPVKERVDPFDMFVNAEATSMRDIRWIAQRIRVPVDDVRSDERYKPGARSRVEGTSRPAVEDRQDLQDRYGDTVQYATVWEFYDISAGIVCVWADGSDEYLIDPVEMPYAFGHPFEMLSNYEVPDEFYPIGDLEMIEPLCLELNQTRTDMLNHRKTNARKYIARTSVLDDRARAALESSYDGEVVEIDSDVPLRDVIAPVPHIPLQADTYAWSDIIQSDMREVSGVSEYQRGSGPDIRRTATEAALIQDATNARSADRLAAIERHIARTARKIISLTAQFMTGESRARIIGRDGVERWVDYTREDLIGEYDFRVEAGSTTPKNDQFRQSQALALMETMLPFVQVGIVDPTQLATHVLREGFDVKNPENFLAQQPEAAPQGGGLPPGPGPQAQAPPEAGGVAGVPPEVQAQLQGQIGLGF